MLTGFVVFGIVSVFVALYIFFRQSEVLVPEGKNAVVVDQHGFIKRVLPTGVHHLKPRLEKVEFFFETKPGLASGSVSDASTSEGILLTVDWSGVFARQADRITEQASLRLRGLLTADKALQRQVDITLRRLLGQYTLQDLFKPAIRERIERQLSETIRVKLAPLGIVLYSLDLQSIHLPQEVAHALNQAKAIETLDTALRNSTAATRHMVTAAHKMEELFEWEKLLPPYGKYMLARSELKEASPAL